MHILYCDLRASASLYIVRSVLLHCCYSNAIQCYSNTALCYTNKSKEILDSSLMLAQMKCCILGSSLATFTQLIAGGTYFALTYLILDFINSDSNGNTVMDPLAPHMSAYDCLPV